MTVTRFPALSFAAMMIILPMVAFAGQAVSDRQDTIRVNSAPAVTCTQLERQVGLSEDKCGHYTISELTRMKFDAED